MKLFECENCRQVLFFENTLCTGCNSGLGYSVEAERLVILPKEVNDKEVSDETPFAISGGGLTRYRKCRNYTEHDACNWLVLAAGGQHYCRSCELTGIIPDLSEAANKAAWLEGERAKRRVLYTLYALKLPVLSKSDDAADGLTFKFMTSTKEAPVMTGHDQGIITLNIAEANAAFRENMREKLGEGYRTVLGHLRHEIGHYYWDRLIRDSSGIAAYRALFGDEREDYQKALERHYAEGPKSDWADSFISAYATMHSWEDWAETWAHYLHMVDTLETAKNHGVSVRVPGKRAERLTTDSLALADFESLSSSWHAVTLALNSLSRSMGMKDVYPFVLSKPVLEKLAFVHQTITSNTASPPVARKTAARQGVMANAIAPKSAPAPHRP